MNPDIEEVWIFNQYGIPIIDYTKDTDLHGGLFESFMTAIKFLLKEVTKKEIKSFSMGDKKFTCKTIFEGNVAIIIRASLGAQNEVIDGIFKEIISIFEELYTVEDILNWYGNKSFFKELEKRLNILFLVDKT